MKGLYKFNDFIERWMAFVTPSCLLFGVLFPQIAKHGVPYVPYVFAFITFTGALKSRFRDVANVFKAPWALLVIMLLLHLVIPGVACGVGNLVFPDNAKSGDWYGFGVCGSNGGGQYDVGDDLRR